MDCDTQFVIPGFCKARLLKKVVGSAVWTSLHDKLICTEYLKQTLLLLLGLTLLGRDFPEQTTKSAWHRCSQFSVIIQEVVDDFEVVRVLSEEWPCGEKRTLPHGAAVSAEKRLSCPTQAVSALLCSWFFKYTLYRWQGICMLPRPDFLSRNACIT